MTALEWINAAIVGVGVPTIGITLIVIGRKLQILDTLHRELDTNIRPDLKDVRERFATLEGKAEKLFAHKSPINLTPGGEKMLNESGLKSYIDHNIGSLEKICKGGRSMATPYDVQQSAIEFFDSYEFPKEIDNQLKTYAFNVGISMDIIRRIGAIYFRNICLEKLGMTPEDLDK